MWKAIGILISLLLISACGTYNPNYVEPSTYTKPLYNLELIGIYSRDTTDKDDVTALFAVTPIDTVHFRPSISMKIGYSINDGVFKEDSRISPEYNCNMIIYGNNISERNPFLYDRIKYKFGLIAYKDVMFLAVNFWDLGTEVNKMKIKYGLWEKNNNRLRIEQEFSAEVE
jgi:hypothetical protein